MCVIEAERRDGRNWEIKHQNGFGEWLEESTEGSFHFKFTIQPRRCGIQPSRSIFVECARPSPIFLFKCFQYNLVFSTSFPFFATSFFFDFCDSWRSNYSTFWFKPKLQRGENENVILFRSHETEKDTICLGKWTLTEFNRYDLTPQCCVYCQVQTSLPWPMALLYSLLWDLLLNFLIIKVASVTNVRTTCITRTRTLAKKRFNFLADFPFKMCVNCSYYMRYMYFGSNLLSNIYVCLCVSVSMLGLKHDNMIRVGCIAMYAYCSIMLCVYTHVRYSN